MLHDGVRVDLRAWHGFSVEHYNRSAAEQMQGLLPKLPFASLMLYILYFSRDSRDTLTGASAAQ